MGSVDGFKDCKIKSNVTMRSDFFYSNLREFVKNLADLSGHHNPGEFLDELMQRAQEHGPEFALNVLADLHHLIKLHSKHFWSERHREEITDWYANNSIDGDNHTWFMPLDSELFKEPFDPSLYPSDGRDLNPYTYSQYAMALSLRNIAISKKGVGTDTGIDYIKKFNLKPGQTLYNKWNDLINGKIQDEESLKEKALEIIKNNDL